MSGRFSRKSSYRKSSYGKKRFISSKSGYQRMMKAKYASRRRFRKRTVVPVRVALGPYTSGGVKNGPYSSKRYTNRLVVSGKHTFPTSSGKDREHFKISATMTGTVQWYQKAMAMNVIDLSNVAKWSSASMTGEWKSPLGSGTNYTFIDTGSSIVPGTELISNRYYQLYISGVKFRWTVAREDHNDDATTTMLMVPLNPTKQVVLTSAGGGAGAQDLYWPGSDDWDSFANMCMEPGIKRMQLSTAPGSKQIGTLEYWIPFKKYLAPGFPLSSHEWWTETTNNTIASSWIKPSAPYFPYLAMGLYNDGAGLAGGDLFSMVHEITWYITAFNPRLESLIFFKRELALGEGKSTEGGGGSDSKEPIEDKKEDIDTIVMVEEDDVDGVDTISRGLSTLVPSTPPIPIQRALTVGSIKPPSSSSSSSSSSSHPAPMPTEYKVCVRPGHPSVGHANHKDSPCTYKVLSK